MYLQNSFTARKVMKLLQNSYDIVHHTFATLPLEIIIPNFVKITLLLKTHFILLALTWWNLNRFSQFFHCWKQEKKVINQTTSFLKAHLFTSGKTSSEVAYSASCKHCSPP